MTRLQACHACGSTDIVTDVSQGDVICRDCGIVLEDRIIDDTPEWNDYAEDDGRSKNKARVGNAVDSNLGSSALDIQIGKMPNSKGFSVLSRTNSVANRNCGDHGLSSYYADIKKIEIFAERMKLSRGIVEGATHTISLLSKEALRMRNKDATVAAILYIACRQDGIPRTLREISLCTGVEKKQLGKYFLKISSVLNLQMTASTTVVEYVNRFCSMLRLPMATSKMAESIVVKANSLNLSTGKNPGTLAGAIIYLSAAITNSRKSIKDIAEVGSLCEVSVKKLCRELNDNRDKLFEGIEL